jgi:bacteriorhodopsin
MVAALFYFILTMRNVAHRYNGFCFLDPVLPKQSWVNAFAYNAASGLYERLPDARLFSIGYGYPNWLIDVPMLLLQILFVGEISRQNRARLRNWFFFSGAIMIITDYIGQFYETTNTTTLLIWGAISTVFFFHVLYLIYNIIADAKSNLPAPTARIMGAIWWLFLFSWMLYPDGNLMPVLMNSKAGVVGRQLIYTVADFSSKVIYGVLIGIVAQIRSQVDGYEAN